MCTNTSRGTGSGTSISRLSRFASVTLLISIAGLTACKKKESDADRYVREMRQKILQQEIQSAVLQAQRAANPSAQIGSRETREGVIKMFGAMDTPAIGDGASVAAGAAIPQQAKVVWDPSAVLDAAKRGTPLPSFASLSSINHRSEEESPTILKITGRAHVTLRVDTFSATGAGINYRGGRIAILHSAHRAGDVIDFEFHGRVGRDHLNYAIAVSIPAEALGRPREEFGRSIVEDTKEGQEIIAAAKAGRSASERLNALSSRLGEVRALLKWSDDSVVRNPARDWWNQGVAVLRRAGYGTEAAQLEQLATKLVGPKWRFAAGSDSDRRRAVELAAGALGDAKRTVQDAQEFERVVRRVDEILSKVQ